MSWLVSPRRRVVLALVALTCVAFAPTLTNGFVKLDDDDYLTQNPVVQRGVTWDGLKWAATSFHAANWHPLTWVSHMVDWELFGPWAPGHHAVGLMLHVLSVVLLFLFLDEGTGMRIRSAAVAALFAVHPLRVESVAWASERKDLLCTLFFIAACWAHLRRVRGGTNGAAVLVLGALALLSKPMAVTLPCALLLLDVWPLERRLGNAPEPWSRLIREKVPLFLLSVASMVFTVLAQSAGGAVSSTQSVPLTSRLPNAIVNVGQYLALTAWPTKLIPFYPLDPTGPRWWQLLAAVAIIAAISGLAWRWRRTVPALAVGWLWFLGTLVPVIGLVQVGAQSVADRYTYLPHVGLFLALVWAGSAAVPPRLQQAWGALLTVSLVAFACESFWLTRFWKDPETLFSHVLALSPDNPMANVAVGVERLREHQLADAERHLRVAVAANPQMATAVGNLANALAAEGRLDEALPLYARARELSPDDLDVAAIYGKVLARAGRLEEAIAQQAFVYDRDPDRPGLALGLGTLLGRTGHPQQAVVVLAHAAQIAPQDPGAHFAYGVALAQRGQFDAAVGELGRAVQLDPAYPGAAEMLRRAREDAGRSRAR